MSLVAVADLSASLRICGRNLSIGRIVPCISPLIVGLTLGYGSSGRFGIAAEALGFPDPEFKTDDYILGVGVPFGLWWDYMGGEFELQWYTIIWKV